MACKVQAACGRSGGSFTILNVRVGAGVMHEPFSEWLQSDIDCWS